MYKLMLVDDEEEVRKGILQKIDWASCGFEIAGEAENGREALEIAEKVVPDVVITDVKMPFLDGIKLSEMLTAKFPATKIIILTGFDEFEYVQKAVKLNVIEYVLKPVSSPELIDILNKTKAKIDEEIAQRENIEALKEHYRKSLPVMREKFLSLLITSRMKKPEIRQKTEQYQICLDGEGFAVSIISVDSGVNSSRAAGAKRTTEDSAFRLPKDLELLKFAVFNIAEEIVLKYNLGTLFMHHDYIVIIIKDASAQNSIHEGITLTALEEIRQSVEKYIRSGIL